MASTHLTEGHREGFNWRWRWLRTASMMCSGEDETRASGQFLLLPHFSFMFATLRVKLTTVATTITFEGVFDFLETAQFTKAQTPSVSTWNETTQM